MTTEPTGTAPARTRNPRGEGGRLREEILAAVQALLDEGPAEAVTLRAVARRTGIAAPSIYRHFPDLDHLLHAAVEDAFTELRADLEVGRDGATSGDGAATARLFGTCEAYLAYARDHPQRYRLMLGGVWNATAALGSGDAERDERLRNLGLNAFEVLAHLVQDCVDEGASSSRAPTADAVALWVGLHGLAELRRTAPLFPWPASLATDLVTNLAHVPTATGS
ncbi:MAG: TetR/AcrR family transcriptional regulator [Janthinobacterium lividum]